MEKEVIDGRVVETVEVPQHESTDTVEMVVTPADPTAEPQTVLVDAPDVPAEVAPDTVEEAPAPAADVAAN